MVLSRASLSKMSHDQVSLIRTTPTTRGIRQRPPTHWRTSSQPRVSFLIPLSRDRTLWTHKSASDKTALKTHMAKAAATIKKNLNVKAALAVVAPMARKRGRHPRPLPTPATTRRATRRASQRSDTGGLPMRSRGSLRATVASDTDLKARSINIRRTRATQTS